MRSSCEGGWWWSLREREGECFLGSTFLCLLYKELYLECRAVPTTFSQLLFCHIGVSFRVFSGVCFLGHVLYLAFNTCWTSILQILASLLSVLMFLHRPSPFFFFPHSTKFGTLCLRYISETDVQIPSTTVKFPRLFKWSQYDRLKDDLFNIWMVLRIKKREEK